MLSGMGWIRWEEREIKASCGGFLPVFTCSLIPLVTRKSMMVSLLERPLLTWGLLHVQELLSTAQLGI